MIMASYQLLKNNPNPTEDEIRVAPVPLRLSATEHLVRGKAIDESLVSLAGKTAMAEIRPIDDIRSTARYRAAVVGNLVAEFLNLLNADGKKA